ncbi:MAG: hypothetical protein ACTS2F_11510 [Thainema sp.]
MTPQVLTSNGGRAAVPASIRQPSWYSQSQLPSRSTLPTLRFCPPQPTDEPDSPQLEPQRLSCYKPSHRDRFLQLQAEANVLLNYLKQVNQHRLQQESVESSRSLDVGDLDVGD